MWLYGFRGLKTFGFDHGGLGDACIRLLRIGRRMVQVCVGPDDLHRLHFHDWILKVGGAHFRHHDVGQTRRIRGRIDRTDQGRHKKSKRNLSRDWESVVERRLGENCAWVSRTGGEVGEGPHLVRGQPTIGMFEVGVLKKCGQSGAALRFLFLFVRSKTERIRYCRPCKYRRLMVRYLQGLQYLMGT